jgi:hypothetical protein
MKPIVYALNYQQASIYFLLETGKCIYVANSLTEVIQLLNCAQKNNEDTTQVQLVGQGINGIPVHAINDHKAVFKNAGLSSPQDVIFSPGTFPCTQ